MGSTTTSTLVSWFGTIEEREGASTLRFPAIVVVVLLVSLFLISLSRLENVHSKSGDAWSRMMVMVAGRNFVERGWIETKLSPVVPVRNSDWSTDREFSYLHYPPFPFYVGGVVYLFGGRSLVSLRVIEMLACFLSVLLFYAVVARVLTSGLAAFAAAAFVFNRVFFYQALESPLIWSELFQMGALLCLAHAPDEDRRKRVGRMLGAWILLGLSSFASLELYFSSAILVFFVAYRFHGRRWFGTAVLICSAMPFAFGIHLLKNAWVMGGLLPVYHDFRSALLWRTADLSAKGEAGKHLSAIGGFAGYPRWLASVVWDKYGLNAISVGSVGIALVWVSRLQERRILVRRYLMCLAVFASASVTYWVVFPQATYIEISVMHLSHWLPAHGLIFGGAIYLLMVDVVEKHRSWAVTVSIGLLLLTGVSLVQNVRASAPYLLRQRDLTYADELDFISRLEPPLATGASVLVQRERPLARFGWLHHPREAFGLPEFEIHLVGSSAEIERHISTAGAAGVYLWQPREESPVGGRLLREDQRFRFYRLDGEGRTQAIRPFGVSARP